jgi:putative oxidoreductase
MLGSASNVAVWVAQIVTAAIFLGAGSGKVVDRPDMVTLFDAIGIGQWFRYVTGMLECTGALLMLAPWTARSRS